MNGEEDPWLRLPGVSVSEGMTTTDYRQCSPGVLIDFFQRLRLGFKNLGIARNADHAEDLAIVLAQADDQQLLRALPGLGQDRNQAGDAGAVDIVHARKVQDDIL